MCASMNADTRACIVLTVSGYSKSILGISDLVIGD
jgi:hypothetical protein